MDKKIKYALYKYSSHNIGDEIQSIAARQFLPKVDYYIDRDRVGSWKNDNQAEAVKLIANGWYMSEPMEWPITDKTLEPLLTSIHINDSDERVVQKLSSKKSIDYLKSREPIGARDETTKKIFKKLGLRTELSACLTLTLERDPSIKKLDYILCVTVSDEVYRKVKACTNRPVIKIDTTTFDDHLSSEEKLKLAEQFLYLYQSAHFVITTRLHAALPSLALETPVLYIIDSGAARYDPSRLDGLKELTNNISEVELITNIESIDFEKPPKNPKDYLKLREKITKECENFTGYTKAKTFAVLNNFYDFRLEASELFKTIIYNYDQDVNNRDRMIDHYIRHTNEQAGQLNQPNSISRSLHKLLTNVSRRIKN